MPKQSDVTFAGEEGEKVLRAIYRVLVRRCGAAQAGEDDFVRTMLAQQSDEYRFMGALGMGGKFWNANGKWYVSCYKEHETPAIKGLLIETDAMLARLRRRFLSRLTGQGDKNVTVL